LPVLFQNTDVDRLPAAVKALTFVETDGSLPGAVAAEAARIARDFSNQRLKRLAMVLSIIVAIGGVTLFVMKGRTEGEIIGRDGAPAVLIPGGKFIMGDDEDSPRREIFLDAFYMDKYEVTVARYASFFQATGNLRAPDEWETVDLQNGGEFPVVGIHWRDASSYCQWAGKRLPTEAEWEMAARGADERKYPWGNDAPTAEHARFGKPYENPVYKDGVAQVGKFSKGASPFGIYDLSGNVWEWVADWYAEGFPRAEVRNPKGPSAGAGKVMRGGGWYDPRERLTTAKRMFARPDHRADDVGFRCARDAK
jgi:formylglycine-generating enzyme required for sulfatase activity